MEEKLVTKIIGVDVGYNQIIPLEVEFEIFYKHIRIDDDSEVDRLKMVECQILTVKFIWSDIKKEEKDIPDKLKKMIYKQVDFNWEDYLQV